MEITVTDVDYAVRLSGDGGVAELTPTIHFSSDRALTLSARVSVDGHELISSHKVSAVTGVNSRTIRSFKIYRPLLKRDDAADDIGGYRLELTLFASEELYSTHVRTLYIAADADSL